MYAYIVLAHTDIVMINRLVSRLATTGDVYVHVDLGSKIDTSEIIIGKNIHVVTKRVSVHWGGYSVVQATLNAIQCILDAPIEYSKVILVSGQDYPVKSDQYIREFFKKKNYIRGYNISEPIAPSINRVVNHYFFNDAHFLVKKFFDLVSHSRYLRKDAHINFEGEVWDIYEGSQWWALNEDVLVEMMSFLKSDRGRAYIHQMKHLHAPDEKFFATFFFNTKFWSSNLKNGPESFNFDVFKYYQGTAYETTAPVSMTANFHKIHASLSKNYTIKDWSEICCAIQDSNVLFVRKVNTQYSEMLLDKIDVYKGRLDE
ncbi:beta-1,6-N-acetylglucosaminyltransferase [Lactiplantibacillus plantarum]|uniref:beta-1,6-N-acetylglucosaminyltransferase n=1 Tax=Lactiplantibacillus plantarum TaxID=1590 RepID=UPI0038554DD5|nr:glycosyl transferase [Lactiplantibacillus plantarum]